MNRVSHTVQRPTENIEAVVCGLVFVYVSVSRSALLFVR